MRRFFFGEWRDGSQALTVADIAELCKRGEERRAAVAAYPIDKVYRVLARARALWIDPSYKLRREVEELLPAETGFSSQMVALGMEELGALLDPAVLARKVRAELGEVAPYTLERTDASGTVRRWHPIGQVLHVLSGNVFLAGAGSLMEGLLTKNLNVLKMSSGEKVFLPRLIQSLCDVDEEGIVSGSIALIDYSSKQLDVIAELKRRVDGIIVWGGEDAVRAYRNDLPARTRIIVFGPKLSFGLVTREGISELGLDAIAGKLAEEISIWDQNACTAPQACYVEGADHAFALARRMGPILEKRARELPAGPATVDQAVEIQKLRGTFEVAEARGLGAVVHSAGNVDWTVIVDRDLTLDPSPLHRTLRIIPFERLDEIAVALAPLRGYLQTAGLAVSAEEAPRIADRMIECGADRVLELGAMFAGQVDDPHDGALDLPQLMHLTFARVPRHAPDIEPWEIRSWTERRALIDSRLRALLAVAEKAPFYRARLEGLKIENADDLVKLAPLTREDMDSNMPPRSNGLGTGAALEGGYVSRSGGSTGEPKFSVYEGRDWEEMISIGTRLFRALGLERGDRLANCMMAGDLYGSFVSFDHINSRLGVHTFAFANAITPEVLVDTWRKFNLNAIQGIPTKLVPLLRDAKKLEPDFRMEKIVYAGAPMSPADASWLRSECGVKRIASVIGANDGGPIAFQCRAMQGSEHHTVDEFNYIELLDENNQPVPEGMPGKLLITSLMKHAYPLIRYELGDQARFIPGRCACGRTARRLEYLGRSDNLIRHGLLAHTYADFEKALEGIPYSVLQIECLFREEGEALMVRVEAAEYGPKMAARVRDALLEKLPGLRKHLENRDLIALETEALSLGSLPRNARSGKVKGIVTP